MEKISINTTTQQKLIKSFPLDAVQMIGSDAVDFLQRITTNDFRTFKKSEVQKTLLITEKGRIVDAIWVFHRGDDLLLLCSETLGNEVISWLNKFIIMEDIQLQNVSHQFSFDLLLYPDDSITTFCRIDYFGIPAALIEHEINYYKIPLFDQPFEYWRIQHGIPVAKKELVQDYNPLELNLWDWISFTKGCYIGQEVIARLDTYNKIQRLLCLIISDDDILEREKLVDEEKKEIGSITSVIKTNNRTYGLAVVRLKHACTNAVLNTEGGKHIVIEKVFNSKTYGRN